MSLQTQSQRHGAGDHCWAHHKTMRKLPSADKNMRSVVLRT